MLKDVAVRPDRGIALVIGRVADRVVVGQRKRLWPMWLRWPVTRSLPSARDQLFELDPVLAVMVRGPR
ncbi:hypothetical protein ACQP1G_09795 [Nocardia sp. CA-107356]|uniref:hypothetical protein n=1 Tax=Nocardia sp. CA-107356 TaxID=3239972 RepID=UPI003D8E1CC3